jgi:hypothetical protein
MRWGGFRACWAHGEDRKFGSDIAQAKTAATGGVGRGHKTESGVEMVASDRDVAHETAGRARALALSYPVRDS